jgi:hypothetical protein
MPTARRTPPAVSRPTPGPGPGEVVVRAHDLARLLFTFRELQRTSQDRWIHMRDYDTSFERLADVLDAHGKPDPRRRCGHQPSITWPRERRNATWYNIRDSSYEAPARHRHLAAERPDGGFYDAYCGFWFVTDDIVRKPSQPYPDCPVCLREQRLRREHWEQAPAGPAVEDPDEDDDVDEDEDFDEGE